MIIAVGNEKEQWSDSDGEPPTNNQAPSSSDIPDPSPPLQSHDGYGSGDLGDVSCSYATEVPNKESSESDQEAGDTTERGSNSIEGKSQ